MSGRLNCSVPTVIPDGQLGRLYVVFVMEPDELGVGTDPTDF